MKVEHSRYRSMAEGGGRGGSAAQRFEDSSKVFHAHSGSTFSLFKAHSIFRYSSNIAIMVSALTMMSATLSAIIGGASLISSIGLGFLAAALALFILASLYYLALNPNKSRALSQIFERTFYLAAAPIYFPRAIKELYQDIKITLESRKYQGSSASF